MGIFDYGLIGSVLNSNKGSGGDTSTIPYTPYRLALPGAQYQPPQYQSPTQGQTAQYQAPSSRFSGGSYLQSPLNNQPSTGANQPPPQYQSPQYPQLQSQPAAPRPSGLPTTGFNWKYEPSYAYDPNQSFLNTNGPNDPGTNVFAGSPFRNVDNRLTGANMTQLQDHAFGQARQAYMSPFYKPSSLPGMMENRTNAVNDIYSNPFYSQQPAQSQPAPGLLAQQPPQQAAQGLPAQQSPGLLSGLAQQQARQLAGPQDRLTALQSQPMPTLADKQAAYQQWQSGTADDRGAPSKEFPMASPEQMLANDLARRQKRIGKQTQRVQSLSDRHAAETAKKGAKWGY